MRPLTETETRTLFEKLAQYIGRNITHLIDRPDDPHCFRIQKDRCYYVSERIMKIATSVARDNLVVYFLAVGITH
jgi:60S ribosome subunit biogenesis protein NIP7